MLLYHTPYIGTYLRDDKKPPLRHPFRLTSKVRGGVGLAESRYSVQRQSFYPLSSTSHPSQRSVCLSYHAQYLSPRSTPVYLYPSIVVSTI